jgi:penicillin-binding protein 2
METISKSKLQSWLLWFLKGVLVLVFIILFARLVELQVIKGAYFRKLSEGNRVRRVPIIAPRGVIRARGGEVIADNLMIEKKIEFSPESGYIKSDDLIGANSEDLITEWTRDYRAGSALGHVSGYLGWVNENEIGTVSSGCPEKGVLGGEDMVGRTGIEEQYDCLLRGVNGEELVEVDSGGVKVRVLGRREPVPGSDVALSIDMGLQKMVSDVLRGQKGAVIVTDAQGEVLAMFSSPSYDPNSFVKNANDDELREIFDNKDLPLFNRAIGGKFAPGSVFKPVVAVAGFEEGVIDEHFLYNDAGYISIKSIYGDFTYNNWYFTQYGGTEGQIDVTRALARSTDTFFYNLGELLGIDNLDRWGTKFGLSTTTGIDIPGEVEGLVPSAAWKERVKGERWFLGNTYHLAIGQGDIALTPVGINNAITTIANGGNLCKPRLRINDEIDKTCENLDINQVSLNGVKSGMIKACEVGGTAYTFFDFEEKYGIKVACKTGTAETFEEADPHAWFVVFAPMDVPEIVATVLIEHGGEGSSVAGPIAREIFDYWYADKLKPEFISPTPTPANE